MARTRRSPDGIYATPGAVAQHGGSLPIYICNVCGMDVVWCESKRTGRKYLVTVSRGHNGARFYVGRNVHKCEAAASNPELASRSYYSQATDPGADPYTRW